MTCSRLGLVPVLFWQAFSVVSKLLSQRKLDLLEELVSAEVNAFHLLFQPLVVCSKVEAFSLSLSANCQFDLTWEKQHNAT